MPFAFEKLLVYQNAIDFANAVCTATRDFPRGYYFLVDQLNRAALSIAANIAEGNGRFTKADRRNFFGIARGSVQECMPLLELAARQTLLTPEQHGFQVFGEHRPVPMYQRGDGVYSHPDCLLEVEPARSWSDDEQYSFEWLTLKSAAAPFVQFRF
jgi:four helix bundle protein